MQPLTFLRLLTISKLPWLLTLLGVLALTMLLNVKTLKSNGPSLQETIYKEVLQKLDKSRHTRQINLWQQISHTGEAIHLGHDEDMRPLFVHIQATVEEVIAELLEKNQLGRVVGIIHTSLPPTPLRTDGKTITKDLVNPHIANDSKRLQTVLARADILRHYLDAGGELYAVYSKRTLDNEALPGEEIFVELTQTYPNLHDHPVGTLPSDKVGATYLFKDQSNRLILFSIMSYQASQYEQGQRIWGVWFGPIEAPKIAQRWKKVSTFFKETLIPGERLDLEALVRDSPSKKP